MSHDGVALPDEIEEAVTFQEYAPAPRIDGVQLLALRKHRADNGSFMEFVRVTDGRVEGLEPPFRLRQASVSEAAARRINAFHIHPLEPQNELWCVTRGLLVVWLIDCRKGSPSLGVRRRVVLTGEEPALLRIPAGVAHGYRAGPSGATLLYLADQQFNPDRPNEGRLPWDYFGKDLWEEDRG